MSTATLTLTEICSGNTHLTFQVTGDVTATVRTTLDDLTAPITPEDKETFCRVIARLVKLGRTQVQARNLLQAGVVINV